MPADVEFGAIDFPTVTWRYIAKRLRIKLPRQSDHSKFLNSISDDLSSLIIGSKRGFIILTHEDLERLEHAKDSFLADFAAAPDAIFLRAHVQQGIAHQFFLANQYSGCLRAANILTTAEGDHVEAKTGKFPEPLNRRNVCCGIVKSVEVVLLRDGDGFRTADLAFVRENIGEVDGYRFRVDGGNHFFARLDFYQLGASLPDLVIEWVAMAFLNDDFVSGEIAYIGNGAHAWFEVFGHHSGVADNQSRGRSSSYKAGVTGRGLTKVCNEFPSCDFEFVDQNEVLVPSPYQLHDLRLHDRAANDRDGAVDVDERCHSQLSINISRRTEPG